MKADITIERARELVHYDKETGRLTSLVRRFGLAPGDVIGHRTARGYLAMKLDGHHMLAHRFIWLWMTGALPKQSIDHINGILDDNRWANLRDVSQAINSQNRHTAIAGATWHKGQQRWVAKITAFGHRRILGNYRTFEEATAAYHRAKRDLLTSD